ncbi:MAG: DUF960 domain-containing protein [Streptococcaceae bacterium]|jgi:hypothetical protein|nr:DUF960 domain-containing protein [Streptococcaceae bacterium]
MAFTHTTGRYASLGTISTIPGDVIDLFWTLLDRNLIGVFDLEPIINFELTKSADGNLAVTFSQPGDLTTVTFDTDYPFNESWPCHFHAVDRLGRETIMTPSEI